MGSLIFNIVQSNVNGGLEKVFVDYAKILNNANFKVICLTSKSFPENKILDQEKITRITLNIKGHFDIFATIKLYYLIKKYQPDLIIAHNGRAFATLNLINKIFKIKTKILAVSHGGNPKRLLNFDYAVGVAKHITSNILSRGFKGGTQTIYNGIEVINFKKNRKSDKIFTFGMMSRLSPEKNIEIGIKSFAKFIQKVNKNSLLLIAGEGKEKEKLIKLVKDLKIKDKVKFIGWTNDQAGFYNKIDVFVQSSLNEPFGLTIIDSFNFKTLVIAANIAGPKEIIQKNKTGFLFDTNDKNSLFLEMKKAFLQRDNLEEIVQAAFKDLNEKFSYKKLSDSLVKFVNLIIDLKATK